VFSHLGSTTNDCHYPWFNFEEFPELWCERFRNSIFVKSNVSNWLNSG